jgi:cyclopropane fatty-acyl-phospholipid synthase-like methyltransferase
LREIDHGSLEKNHAAKMKFIEEVRARKAIADVPEKANEQHYEVSTQFILSTLGPYAKYSSCLYPTGNETVGEAEVLMLESYCEKAQLRDGLDVLDLGCGAYYRYLISLPFYLIFFFFFLQAGGVSLCFSLR